MNNQPATSILTTLGYSLANEDLKGDFASARQCVEDWMAQTQTSGDLLLQADALIWRAIVHILQGELLHADTCLKRAEEHAAGDVNLCLRIVAYRLLTVHERYNTFPDCSGAAATEISARWSGAEDIRQSDAQFHDLIKRSTDASVQDETWLVYGFFCNLKSARAMLEASRFAPAGDMNQQILENSLNSNEGLRTAAESRGLPAVAAYPDWWSADLWRRAGDLTTATQHLARAESTFERAGDVSGIGLCRMTRADWRCAPFSSPLAWNLALQDSSSEGSHLSITVENQEFSRPTAADIQQSRVEYAEADRLFQQAGSMRGAAAIQLRYGYLAMLDNDFQAAGESARKAGDDFDKCGDWRSVQTSQIHLAMAQIGIGREAEAVEAARAVGRWGREQGNFSFALGLGIALNRWARHWLIRGGDYERALASYRASHELFHELQATANAIQNIVDLGAVHQAIGERDTASIDFENALERYEYELEQRPQIAENLRQRTILLSASAYQLCLQRTDSDGMQRNADRLKQQLARLPDATGTATYLSEPGGSASGDMPTGVVFWALRNFARSLVDQAAVLVPLYRSRSAKDTGDERQAQRSWDEAESALLQVSDDQRPFLAVSVYAERHMYDRAAGEFRQYLNRGGANAGFSGQITQLMQATGGAVAQAEVQVQQIRTHIQAFSVFVRVKSYDEARSHLDVLQKLAGEDWWSEDTRPWQPLSDCGEMYEGLSDFPAALNYYNLAIRQLEARRSQLTRDELKTAISSQKGAQYLYFLAARSAIRNKQFELAFDYAEQGKARALLDLMAAAVNIGNIPKHEAPELQSWRQLSAHLALQRGLLSQEHRNPQPDAQRVVQLNKEIGLDEQKMRTIEATLSRSFPSFHQAVSVTAKTLSVQNVAESLSEGTTLIAYFYLGEELLVWAIDRQGLKQAAPVTLDTTALNRDIQTLRLACETCSATGDVSARLSAALIEPIAATIRASSRLIIVPYGLAHALPFHLLPLDDEPIGASRTITYLPSASVLQFLNDKVQSSTLDQILVVGNPTGDLNAAAAEATFVASLYDVQPLIGEAATEEAVRRRISDAKLLHFATHGNLSANSPLSSSLTLAGGGELSVYELMGLRLNAKLVVLSACNTGRGEATGGDDVLGLSRGLLAAGAQAVVVSLWPVDDLATSLFMREFYSHFRQGEEPACALSAAQNYLRTLTPDEVLSDLATLKRDLSPAQPAEPYRSETAVKDYSHPHFWAPFILIGA